MVFVLPPEFARSEPDFHEFPLKMRSVFYASGKDHLTISAAMSRELLTMGVMQDSAWFAGATGYPA